MIFHTSVDRLKLVSNVPCAARHASDVASSFYFGHIKGLSDGLMKCSKGNVDDIIFCVNGTFKFHNVYFKNTSHW